MAESPNAYRVRASGATSEPEHSISIRSRRYDLPRDLMRCPECSSGHLIWDGRWAWRCDSAHRYTNSAGQHCRCRHGLALSAVFADDLDLIEALELGKPLRLSAYAVELLFAGVIAFPHLPRLAVEIMHRGLPDAGHGDAPEDEDHLARLLASAPSRVETSTEAGRAS